MFAKIFALFALSAVAFAAPSPKAAPAPEPAPQLLAYNTGLEYAYPGVAAPIVSPYASPYASPYTAPVAYSAYSAFPGAVYYR